MSLDASSLFAQDGFAQNDAGPLYVRLQDRIKRAIKNGSLKPLAALPGDDPYAWQRRPAARRRRGARP